MSYDIRFKVQVQDTDIQVPIGQCDANITWNVREIITESTGLEWKNEQDNGFCADVMPKIIAGLAQLRKNGDAYKKYESPNGWGTVAGTMRFFTEIINGWQDTRLMYPDLENKIHFWVE